MFSLDTFINLVAMCEKISVELSELFSNFAGSIEITSTLYICFLLTEIFFTL